MRFHLASLVPGLLVYMIHLARRDVEFSHNIASKSSLNFAVCFELVSATYVNFRHLLGSQVSHTPV